MQKTFKYLLVINGEEIEGHSPVYLRNVALRKGGDWAIYLCFRSKGMYGANFKLKIDQMREAKKMFNRGMMLKDIAPHFNVTPSCIGDVLRKNPWL